MSSFQIKLIAIVTMIVDHIGLFFFPQVFVLRMIGRLAFPLFAWLIATGARHTKNIYHYLARLFVFGLISQAPYVLANERIDFGYSRLNVMFTLFLGLCVIAVIKKYKNKWIWAGTALVACLLAILFSVSFGAMGVLSIVAFYLYYNNLPAMIASQTIIYFLQLPLYVYSNIALSRYIAPLAVLSIIFISLYTGQQGKKAKYLFYAFYPLQYVAFYLFLSFFK